MTKTESERFETFRVFNTQEQASSVAITLQNNGIEVLIDNNTQSGGLVGDMSSIEIPLRIRRCDFSKAEEILGTIQSEIEYEGNEDHPFFEFTVEELTDVIYAPFDWEAYDYKLALSQLKKKGITFSDEQLKEIRDKQLAKIAEPQPNAAISFAGYFVAIVGLITCATGVYLILNKYDGAPFYYFAGPMLILLAFALGKSCLVNKTLPTGKNVPQFNESCRRHGRLILKLTFIMLIITILLFILPFFIK